MSKKVITISREFGSGGRAIGKMVAEKLGIAFYDKEIIAKVAEKTGFAEEFIEKNGEYAPSKNIFSYAFIGRDSSGNSIESKIYAAQQKLIREIAENEDCVIVGRCSDYILRDMENVINVFICGNKPEKFARIKELYGKDEDEAFKMMRDMDKKRSVNYSYYTDQKWGLARNYTLTLNSSRLGYEKCVDIICSLT